MSAVAVLGSSTAWVIYSEAQGWTPLNHRYLVNTYGGHPSGLQIAPSWTSCRSLFSLVGFSGES